MELYRGLDASTNAFVSTAYPPVLVQPSDEFQNVAHGSLYVHVAEGDGMLKNIPVDAWYALYRSERAQMAVIVAQCSDQWIWEISTLGVEYQRLQVLRSYYGDGSRDATLNVYVRTGSRDPWMPIFAEYGSSWEGDVLVARYEWCTSHDTDKLLVEYREPLPAPKEELLGRQTLITEFLERAQAAFSLAPVPETVAKGSNRRNLSISDRLLAPVIGSVTRPVMFEDM